MPESPLEGAQLGGLFKPAAIDVANNYDNKKLTLDFV